MSSALTFASVLTLTFQFLIFAYVYSSHRVRFFYYLLLAWGLMSVSKGLHLARTFLPEWDVLSALLNASFLVATLLVLASGLALRSDYRISKRALVISGLGALVAAGFGDLSDASVTARSTAGFVTGGILILGGLQFWPRRGQPRYRGTRFLSGALALWGVHRIVSPFFNPAPETGGYLTIHATFMFCYFLATFAIIIMVLDRARSETAALKEFNERLVDGLGEGLWLVDGDFRIRHANRWMHGQFGPIGDRRCYGVLTADGQRWPGCPLRRWPHPEAHAAPGGHARGRRSRCGPDPGGSRPGPAGSSGCVRGAGGPAVRVRRRPDDPGALEYRAERRRGDRGARPPRHHGRPPGVPSSDRHHRHRQWDAGGGAAADLRALLLREARGD